tara:strand:- start:478 stop:1557 length:1080 start_codon:yes stop_codon:yes gene_type:complete
MLVGNNIALVIYGIIMTKILTPNLIQHIANDFSLLFVQTIITTIIVLVTAEFLPKAIFRIYPNQTLKFFSIPIFCFFIILRPVAILMFELSSLILKFVFRQDYKQVKQVFDKKDLDAYLSQISFIEGEQKNIPEVEMLQNAIDLTDKKIRECMIPRTEIIAVDLNTSIQELRSKFVETKLSKILIFKGNIDKVIGYVHSSDLFKNPNNIKAILLPIAYVPESMFAMELLNQFISNDQGIALVVDEFGGTSGMLTIEDVTEEIVGEIVDEHDQQEFIDIKISETSFKFSARLDVEAVNKKYHLSLPESDDYETIAGLILHYTEAIPKQDDIVVVNEFRFTATNVTQNGIQEVFLEVVLKE